MKSPFYMVPYFPIGPFTPDSERTCGHSANCLPPEPFVCMACNRSWRDNAAIFTNLKVNPINEDAVEKEGDLSRFLTETKKYKKRNII